MKQQDPRTLDLIDTNAAKKISDVKVWGSPDTFVLIAKASSEKQGWMKSTKAMPSGNGVTLQVTTRETFNGSVSVAEALEYVPGVQIIEKVENDEVVSRAIVRSLNPSKAALGWRVMVSYHDATDEDVKEQMSFNANN